MKNNQNKKFMLLAIKKAKEGIKSGQSPFGAIIVKGNKIISQAYNTVWKNTDITSHAEINAIRLACKKLKNINLKGCVIYSTCEPCPMCFSACHWAKISKIIFSTRINDAKKCGFSELFISNKKMKKIGKGPVKVKGDFLRKEGLEVFKLWTRQKNRRVY